MLSVRLPGAPTLNITPIFTSIEVVTLNMQEELNTTSTEYTRIIERLDAEEKALELEQANTSERLARIRRRRGQLTNFLKRVTDTFNTIITTLKELIQTLLRLFNTLLSSIANLIQSMENAIVGLATFATIQISQIISTIRDFVVNTIYTPMLDGFSQSKAFNNKKANNEQT